MITEQQSCAFDIRDTFYNAVAGDTFFAGYTSKKNKMVPVQADQLPFLGVYLVDEVMTPDGDANAGCVRFCHTARIGFSVINANNDQVAAETGIDQAFLRIQSVLFTSQHIMNVLQQDAAGNNNVEDVMIESSTRGTRRMRYGSAGLRNETPFVELEYEVSAFFRTEWYPDITDTLNEIDVTTYVDNDQNIIPIKTVYELAALRRQLAAQRQQQMHRAPRPPLRQPWLLARDQRRG